MFNKQPAARRPFDVMDELADVKSDQIPAPSAASKAGEERINLSRPITTHSGQASVLIVREPRFDEFIDLGPIISMTVVQNTSDDGVSGPTRVQPMMDRDKLMRWMALLTGQDRVVLSNLAPADASKVTAAVMRQVGAFLEGNS